MVSLVISILIVYGITLILVQGKIFEPLKIKLSMLVSFLELNNKLPDDEYVAEQIAHRNISEKLLIDWDVSLRLLQHVNPIDSDKLNLYHEENKKIFEKIREELKPSNPLLVLILYKFFSKLEQLLQCMMCTGFWVGVILCIVTLIGNISIFGLSLAPITSTGYNIPVAIFLMAGLFSGTTWAITSLVDLLYELKERLGDLIKGK